MGKRAPAVSSSSTSAPIPSEPGETPPARESVTVLAGGDISFGRLIGQLLLRDPSRDFFKSIDPWLRSADIRFANLEGPLSDQHGETQSPDNVLVFTGPPSGAAALARSHWDVVSTANNHAWDYGPNALLETLGHLNAAGVKHVGTGADLDAAWAPVVIDVGGIRVGFLAVTDIWNQGPLESHPGSAFVARADRDRLVASIRALRTSGRVDTILVSQHGGVEYTDVPLVRGRELLRSAIDAGADAVIGHHPHVIQGVEWYHGKPILYSVGNLLMRMASGHQWTEFGYLARLVISRQNSIRLETCPFRIFGTEIRPLFGDSRRSTYEKLFFDHLQSISVVVGRTAIDPPGEDGCAILHPAVRAH